MGLWDFFRKNKKKERIQEADESGMFHLESENSHGTVGDLEEQKIDFDSKEESDLFIQSCCDRIIEASREIEEAKVEYGAVTAYLMDMQKIDLMKIKPTIYAPYQYFSIGEKLGEMGEWEKHLK